MTLKKYEQLMKGFSRHILAILRSRLAYKKRHKEHMIIKTPSKIFLLRLFSTLIHRSRDG